MPTDRAATLRWQGLAGLVARILLSGGLYLPAWLARHNRALARSPGGPRWSAPDLLLTTLVLGSWAVGILRYWQLAPATWPLPPAWLLPAAALSMSAGWSLVLRPALAAATGAPVSLPATALLGPLYLQARVNRWRQQQLERFKTRHLRAAP
jgi:hypothetical protein